MDKLYPFLKRFIDLVTSCTGLLLLFPLMLIIALFIKLESKGPIFFKQKRIGIYKSHFYILKFRTMYADTPGDIPTHLLNDPSKFITRTGRFLRKTSLDELPQIFNIIAGQMAIIGPRPALWNQFDLVAERDKYHANDVLPGLSGWAQINGRDELPINEKARLDGEYIQKMGLAFDFKCLVKTILCVLKSDGLVEGNISNKKLIPIK